MHFIVTWEIYTQNNRERINDALKACLDGQDIVKVLDTSYVVKIEQQQTYAQLHKEWSEVAQQHEGQVEFIMSPLMKSGQYAGYFRQDKWERLTAALENGPNSG